MNRKNSPYSLGNALLYFFLIFFLICLFKNFFLKNFIRVSNKTNYKYKLKFLYCKNGQVILFLKVEINLSSSTFYLQNSRFQYSLLNDKKIHSRCFVLEPGAQKTFWLLSLTPLGYGLTSCPGQVFN